MFLVEPAQRATESFARSPRALNSFLFWFPRLAALARGYYSVALRAEVGTRRYFPFVISHFSFAISTASRAVARE